MRTLGSSFSFVFCAMVLALLGGFVGVFIPTGAASGAEEVGSTAWVEAESFALGAPQGPTLDRSDAGSLAPICRPDQLFYWKLDEPKDSDVFVDSQDGRDATCLDTECPKAYAAGKVDGAQDFDGVNDRLATASAYNPTTGITAMAWIRPDTLTGRDKGIFFKRDVFYLELESDTDFSIDFSVYVNGVLLEYEPAGYPVPIDQWTHIAGTYDGTDLKVYVNGVLIPGSVKKTGSIDIKNNPYYIGYSLKESEIRHFDGKIDDVAVFKKALSEAEIARVYVNCRFQSMMPLVIETLP